MKLSRIIISIIILGLLALLLGGVYTYVYVTIFQKKDVVVRLNQEIINEEDKVKRFTENKALFEQVTDKRELLDRHFLGSRDEDAVGFLETLERLASTTNVRLAISAPTFLPIPTKIKASAKIANSKDPVVLSKEKLNSGDTFSKWEILQLQITVDGSWQDVMQFIALAELMPYQVSFTQATLTASTKTEQKKKQTIWNGVFTLNVIKNK